MKSLPGISRTYFCKSDFSHLRILKCLLIDFERHLAGCMGLARDYVTLEARFEHEGVGFLTNALVSYGKALDKGLATGQFAAPYGFSCRRGEVIPKLFRGVTCKVFDPTTGKLQEDGPDITAISLLRQVCFLWKKLETTPEATKRLQHETESNFARNDGSIGQIDDQRLSRLSYASRMLLQGLDDFVELKGRHGPGAVTEGYSSNQKWSALYSALVDWSPPLVALGYDLPLSGREVPDCGDRDSQVDDGDSTSLPSGIAKLICVPKTNSSLRTITVEPCINQFMQQALGEWLRENLRSDPITRACLDLTDQSLNQQLAIDGSRTGEWVTVDLSSASDLLSLQLVKTVFACRPRFLSALMVSRTPFVKSGDNVIGLKKFAGMGNACTFPVQSYIFALIAIVSMIGDKSITIQEMRKLARNVRVYGDDIIIKREHYPAFADWIMSCGLVINHGKTFSEGLFRESCGVDAYGGTNVTPLYLRFDPTKASTDAKTLVHLVSLANRLWSQGLLSTSDYLKRMIDRFVKLPIVCPDSSGLGYTTRQGAYLNQRWNKWLQRFETKTLVPVAKRRPDILDGYPALVKYFHTPSTSEYDPNHLSSSVRRFTLSLRWRWVPSA